MTMIKEGYGGKPTEIEVYAQPSGNAELWIRQEGVAKVNPVSGIAYPLEQTHSHTLAYMTLMEVVELRDELNKAITGMAGL